MRKLVLLMLLVGMLSNVALSQAQQNNATPLVLLKGGDLWTWEAETGLKQITTWGYNGVPYISPLGDWVAYTSTTRQVVEQMEANDGQMLFAGVAPNNIWLINPVTTEAERIADQPANFSLESSTYIIRSDPAWSYDGRYLAWIEYTQSGLQLVLYDVPARASQIIVPELPFPFMDGGVYVPPVTFGNAMLAYTYPTFNPDQQRMEQHLEVYDLSGKRLSQTVLGDYDTGFAFDHVWVNHNTASAIILLYNDGTQRLLDPFTGSMQVVEGQLRMVNPSASNGMAIQLVHANDYSTIQWQPDQANTPLSYTALPHMPQIALSPDGQQLAYITDTLYLWQNGQLEVVPGTPRLDETPNGLAWGYTAWEFEFSNQ